MACGHDGMICRGCGYNKMICRGKFRACLFRFRFWILPQVFMEAFGPAHAAIIDVTASKGCFVHGINSVKLP